MDIPHDLMLQLLTRPPRRPRRSRSLRSRVLQSRVLQSRVLQSRPIPGDLPAAGLPTTNLQPGVVTGTCSEAVGPATAISRGALERVDRPAGGRLGEPATQAQNLLAKNLRGSLRGSAPGAELGATRTGAACPRARKLGLSAETLGLAAGALALLAAVLA